MFAGITYNFKSKCSSFALFINIRFNYTARTYTLPHHCDISMFS